MFEQFEDAAVVKAETFPNGVATLHRGVERADGRLVAVHEPAVDVNDQVAVLLVKLLEHGLSFRARRGTSQLVRESHKQSFNYNVLCADFARNMSAARGTFCEIPRRLCDSG